jgi:hypothetical protein
LIGLELETVLVGVCVGAGVLVREEFVGWPSEGTLGSRLMGFANALIGVAVPKPVTF